MHEADVRASTQDVEIQLGGDAPHTLDPDLVAIPTPGHTRGSACLLVDDDALFTGDHLAFSRSLDHVYAFSGACWYDWTTQIASVARLNAYSFSRIFPGHGAPCHFGPAEMRFQIERCVEWMHSVA